MLCEVKGTQGLKPSHLSPDYGHVILNISGFVN